MASATIHVGDVGTVFRDTVADEAGDAIDLSGATTLLAWFLKPDGTTLEAAASLTTDGLDGKVEYTVVAGDLDQAGGWKFQVYAGLSGSVVHGDQHKFKVLPNLRADPA